MTQVNRFQLANGLRVVHNYDPSTAMVAVDVLYDVGARDENPEMTGLAHLFEHLMFGGSANAPDFDGALSQAGGMSNAWTSNDFTNFYSALPAHNVATALWLESDRMGAMNCDPAALEVQRGVVIEEFKQQCLNQPYGDADHHLRGMVYTAHPYRYPVIGKDFSHIEKVRPDDVRRFYHSHYAPNNAVLAIAGNVDYDTARSLAEHWFGDLEPRAIAPRLYPDEPEQTAARVKAVSGNVPQTAIIMAWPMAGYTSPDYRVADTITDILANGRSSRFYRRLLMDAGLFTEVDASIAGSEHPGMLLVNAKLKAASDEASPQQLMAAEQAAIEAIDDQIGLLTADGVGDYELEKVLNRFESNITFSNLSYANRAQAMALAEMHGEHVDDTVAAYRRITPEDIRRTARDIFRPERRSTLIYRPQSSPLATAEPDA